MSSRNVRDHHSSMPHVSKMVSEWFDLRLHIHVQVVTLEAYMEPYQRGRSEECGYILAASDRRGATMEETGFPLRSFRGPFLAVACSE